MAEQQAAAKKKELVEDVLKRVATLSSGGFVVPEGYLVENEVRQAYFLITQPRQGEGDYGKPIMEVCSEESVANALFNMVCAGLSAIRKQCYFIPYGKDCQMQRSYFGTEAIAKRTAGVVKVSPMIIHEDDVFTHIVDDGEVVGVKHEPAAQLANLDKAIIGAYCFVKFKDGSKEVTIMTMAQIRKAWDMSRAKGEKNKLQTQFSVDAAIRTIINKSLKRVVNTSQDATIYEQNFDDDIDEQEYTSHEVVTDQKSLPPKTVSLPPATPKVTVPVEKPKEPVAVETPKTEPAPLVEQESDDFD